MGLVTGPRARTPRTHSQWVVGPGRAPERTSKLGWERARPQTPCTQARSAPPGRPRAAPTAPNLRARPARKSARGGVGDGSPRPHPAHGERAAPSQVGGNETPPPPQAGQMEHGARAGHAEGQGLSGTAPPAPSTGTARGARPTPNRGGGAADAARAQAHTHTKDTRGKPEGQPDRARGTHRPHGMAYQRARIRDTQTGRPATHSAGNAGRAGGNREDTTPGTGPNPPEPAARAAHTRPGHCICQGSSGA